MRCEVFDGGVKQLIEVVDDGFLHVNPGAELVHLTLELVQLWSRRHLECGNRDTNSFQQWRLQGVKRHGLPDMQLGMQLNIRRRLRMRMHRRWGRTRSIESVT